jgi:hypothetical protein
MPLEYIRPSPVFGVGSVISCLVIIGGSELAVDSAISRVLALRVVPASADPGSVADSE